MSRWSAVWTPRWRDSRRAAPSSPTISRNLPRPPATSRDLPWQSDKLADFKKLVTDFVKLQIDYSSRVQGAWRELLPVLDNMQRDGPPPPHGASPSAPRAATDISDI